MRRGGTDMVVVGVEYRGGVAIFLVSLTAMVC